MRCVQIGIHTFSLFQKLSYAEAQEVTEELYERKNAFLVYKGRHGRSRIICSTYFRQQGIVLYVNQLKGAGSGLIVRINPSKALEGKKNPTALYSPKRTSYRTLEKKIEACLNELDCPFRMADMSLCRADPCINIRLDSAEEKRQLERIISKGAILRNYQRDFFRKDSKQVKDPREANQHSYRQSCKPKGNRKKSRKNKASFTVYDKIYQLQQIDNCPEELLGKHMLRLEAELSRQALLSRLPQKIDKRDTYALLRACYDAAPAILERYLKRMLLVKGTHLPFGEAEQMIQTSALKAKMQNRMLYLLRKTSDCENLTAALAKTKDKLQLSDKQCRSVLNSFGLLGIHPITLPNRAKITRMDSLLQLVYDI